MGRFAVLLVFIWAFLEMGLYHRTFLSINGPSSGKNVWEVVGAVWFIDRRAIYCCIPPLAPFPIGYLYR